MNDSEMIIDPIKAESFRAYQILCHLCMARPFRKVAKLHHTFPSKEIEQKLATRTITFPESLRALRKLVRDPATFRMASQLVGVHARMSSTDAGRVLLLFVTENEHLIDSDKSLLILPTSAR